MPPPPSPTNMPQHGTLPISSVSEKPAETRRGLSLHPAFYVASWIFFSNITILFNKYLIDDAGFRYPVILTFWHMAFASLATQVLARTTSLLDGRHNIKMTRGFYMRAVVPIGLLYSGSMVCSNLVYLYLNVAFIQMLKAAAPFSTLVVAWLWGQEDPSTTTVLKILVIVSGVVLASVGEVHFSWVGFLYHLGGLVFESVRVVMIQALVSSAGMNMDPLVSLYYYAPVCTVTNFVVALAVEGRSFQWAHGAQVGVWMLLLNAFIAFLLNVSSVMLIGKTSGLVLHLTGVLKNILLVVASILIWGTAVTPLQVLGYGIALAGFVFYRSSLEELKATFLRVLSPGKDGSSSWLFGDYRASSIVPRIAIAVVSLFLTFVLLFFFTDSLQYLPPSVAEQADRLRLEWLSKLGYGE